MKKILFAAVFMLSLCLVAQAQFGKRLGDAISDAAQNAAVRKAQQKTDDAVSKSIDKATDPKTYKDNGNNSNSNSNSNSNNNNNNSNSGNNQSNGGRSNASASGSTATPQNNEKALEMSYAKSDFVPGDEIIFDDNMNNEQLGEFPSQWDLLRGNAEIAAIDGRKVIMMVGGDVTDIQPLMKTPKNYLGDVFTLEFDYYLISPKDFHSYNNGEFELFFLAPDKDRDNIFRLIWGDFNPDNKEQDMGYYWTAASGELSGSAAKVPFAQGMWHHIAVSFNKRALKIYIDGNRIANVPNVANPPGWVCFHWRNQGGENSKNSYIKDVRIAKGAVPLYDRLASEGKIITYGITFDVGKSTIKPESMGEINRIAKLMTDNPDIKFSVEGHTDNTGNAASNQTLSEARSKAIMDKLVELGISSSRLKSVGKGQTSPIADNSTDEGRAKNRRVEFVKI